MTILCFATFITLIHVVSHGGGQTYFGYNTFGFNGLKPPSSRNENLFQITWDFRFALLPPANEVWGKVICLQVCVCPRGGAWSGGMSSLGGLVPWGAWSHAWSWGCLVQGVPGPRWGVPGPGGAWWRPPKRLLLRAVRILLECILVVTIAFL